jgi:hypothetical protein
VRRGVVVLAIAVAATVVVAAAAGSPSAVDPKWRAVAAQLAMPVFAPTKTVGLTLTKIVPAKPKKCESIPEQLDAYYTMGTTVTLRIAEGKPVYCADFGDAPVLSQPTIHKQAAFLLNYCDGAGCPAKNTFLLSWAERGVRIYLVSRGVTRLKLMTLATSMRVVPG